MSDTPHLATKRREREETLGVKLELRLIGSFEVLPQLCYQSLHGLGVNPSVSRGGGSRCRRSDRRRWGGVGARLVAPAVDL
jgi:hypothetical protein